MAPTSVLAIFIVWHLKPKKELDSSCWLSLTPRNSHNSLLLSGTPLCDQDGALCPQNGFNLSEVVLFLYLNIFSVLKISLLGKRHTSLYIGNSIYGLKNFWGPNSLIHQKWDGVSIDIWWRRGSFLKLFRTQQNGFTCYVGGRKWSLWHKGGTANLNLERSGMPWPWHGVRPRQQDANLF